jgi:hypothetical protein
MLKSLIGLLFLIISFFSIAQEKESTDDGPQDVKKFILIQPFKTPYLEFLDEDRVNKIILRATTKQTEYELAMTNLDDFEKAKVPVFQVQLQLEKIKDKEIYEARALLVDMKNKKLVNKVEELRIPRIELLRRIEELLNRLFLQPVPEVKKRVRPVRVKNSPIDQAALNENKALVNFRDRIMDLKFGVQDKFEEIIETNKAANANVSKKNDSSENLVPANELLELDGVSDIVPEPTKIEQPAVVKQHMSVGYRVVTVNSKDVIDTDTSLSYLDLSYHYQRNIFGSTTHFWGAEGRYGKMASQFSEEVGDRVEAEVGYQYYFDRLPLMLNSGVDYHTVSFINLPAEGKGLVAGNLGIVSWYLEVQGRGKLWKYPALLSVHFSNAVSTSGDYKTVAEDGGVKGSTIMLDLLTEKVFRKFNAGVRLYVQNYQSLENRLQISSSGMELYASMYF